MKRTLNILSAMLGMCFAISLCMASCQNGDSNSLESDTAQHEFETLGEDTRSLDNTLASIIEDRELISLAFANTLPTNSSLLSYEQTVNGICITGYTGDDIILVIPSEINGLTVTEVAPDSFKGMTALRAVSVPDSVTKIGKGAFSGCTSLVTLKLPFSSAIYDVDSSTNGYFGYIFGALNYNVNAGAVPPSLKTVILTGKDCIIPDYSFYDCNDIVCISLPDTSKEIGNFAFSLCEALEYIELGSSLSTIGEFAFNNCAKLLDITLPQTVTKIGFGAMQGCNSLATLTLPFVGGSQTENTYLGYIFGAESYSLTKNFIPHSLIRVSLLSGCTSIPDNAFYSCESIRQIILPEGVTKIGYRTFKNCKRLTQMPLPDTVKEIGDSAFGGCINLKEIYLGNSLLTLGVQVFMNCSSLAEISLPSSLTSIPASTFDGCTSLEKVSWENITSIGKNAFRNCISLVTFPNVSNISDIESGNSPLFQKVSSQE